MSLIPNFPPLEVDVREVREKMITMEQKSQAAKLRVSLGLRQTSISGSEGGGKLGTLQRDFVEYSSIHEKGRGD